jgi:hypothetical protein
MWAATYLELPVPTIRYWVIFNNQLRPLPQVTAPTWPAIVARSLEMSTRGDGHRHPASVCPGGHRGAQAWRSSRSPRGCGAERFCAAQDFVPPKPGVFIKETMNALADLGERLGADPARGRTEAP